MVAIINGLGLGLFGSTAGSGGNAALGQGRDRVYVNTANGNLVVQSDDGVVFLPGIDLPLTRTYNSQGLLDDDNGDNWKLSPVQRLYGPTGTTNTAGSSIIKVFGDGHEVRYTYDVARAAYVSTEGDGAHDTLTFVNQLWQWTEGSTGVSETYDFYGRLESVRNKEGHGYYVEYRGSLLERINGFAFEYDGNNLVGIRGRNETTRYIYDSLNRLSQVVVDLTPGTAGMPLPDADNNGLVEAVTGETYITTYTYHGASRRIATIAQTDGSSVAFDYQLVGGEYRVSSYTDGEGRTTSLSYTDSPVAGAWTGPSVHDSPSLFPTETKIALDASGDGFAIWHADSNVFVRRYTRATDTWGPLTVIDAGMERVRGLSISVDDSGNAIAVWAVQLDPAGISLHSARFDAASGTWSAADTIPTGTQYPDLESVAVTNGRDIAVVWAEYKKVHVARFVNGAWIDEVVGTGSSSIYQQSITMDDNGNIAVIWAQTEGNGSVLYMRRRSASTGAWDAPAQLAAKTDGGMYLYDAKVAYSASGDGLLIWREDSGLISRRYSAATNTWSSNVMLETSSSVQSLSLAFAQDRDGNAVISWLREDSSTSYSLLARRFDPSTGTWTETTTLANVSYKYDISTVGAAVNGVRAVVSWRQPNAGHVAARFDGTAWSAAQSISQSRFPQDPGIAMDSVGNITAVWLSNGLDQHYSVYTNRFSAGLGTWAGPVSHYTPTNHISRPRVVFDSSGNAMAVWAAGSQNNPFSNRWTLQSQRYDRASNTWGPIQSVVNSSNGMELGDFELVCDAAGNMSVVWMEASTFGTKVSITSYDSLRGWWSQPWSPYYDYNNRDMVPSQANVAAASNGQATVVVWTVYNYEYQWDEETGQTTETETYSLYASRRIGMDWSEPELIASGDTAYSQPTVAITATGNVSLAWRHGNNIYSASYDATAAIWSTPALAETGPAAAAEPTLIFDASGNGLLVWRQGSDVYARRYTAATNTWSNAVTIDSGNGAVQSLQIALDAQGNGVAAWVQNDGATRSAYVSRFDATTGTWTAAVAVEGSSLAVDSTQGNLAVAITGSRAVVSWLQTDGTRNNLYAARFNGISWSAAELIESSLQPAAEPTVSIDGAGNITVLWRQSAGHFDVLYANRYVPGSGALRRTDVTDAFGAVTSYITDPLGRVVRTFGPNVNGSRLETSYEYDGQGNVLSIIEDPLGLNRATTFEYDANGNVLLRRDADGVTTQYTYSATNQLLARTQFIVRDPDASGPAAPSLPLTTRYVYGAKNVLRFEISPTGRVIEYRYWANPILKSKHVYNGAIYDVSNLSSNEVPSESTLAGWVSEQDATSLQQVELTEYDHDPSGHMLGSRTYAATDSAGAGIGTYLITHYRYNHLGQVIEESSQSSSLVYDPNGSRTYYTYDGLGRLLTTSVSGGATTITSYDDSNRRTETVVSNGLVTTRMYNRAGELISVLNGSAAAKSSLGTTTYSYDAAGRLRIAIDAEGARQFYLYDAASRKIGEIDGDGTLTEFIYDTTGRLIKTVRYAQRIDNATLATLVDADGKPLNPAFSTLRAAADDDPVHDRIARSVYDAGGRLTHTIDEVGAVTQYVYDGAGRLIEEVRYATPVTIARTVDQVLATSLELVRSSDDRRTRHFYDADGNRVGTLDALGYLVEYQYDPVGNLRAQIAYATRTNEAYWLQGTLDDLRPPRDDEQSVTPEQDIISRFFYDGRGRRVGVLDAEGYLTATVYDILGRVAATHRYNRQLTYTPNGNPNEEFNTLRNAATSTPAVTTHTHSYQYDFAGRLVQEINYQGTVTTYTYDSVGNLLGKTQAAGTDQARTTAARYDLMGRVTKELTAEGRALIVAGMTQAQIDSIWERYSISYAYDLAGRRISATTRPNDDQTSTTLYFYDEDNRLRFEVNALGERKELRYNAFGQLEEEISYNERISTTGLSGGKLTEQAFAALTSRPDDARDARTIYGYTLTGKVASLRVATTGSIDSNYASLTTYGYDAFGDLRGSIEAIDATRSAQHEYTYDKLGRLKLTRWDPTGFNTTQQRSYDPFGRLIETIDARDNSSQIRYDRLGRQIETIDRMDGSRVTTYDAFSRTLTTTDAQKPANVTHYTYDDAARTMTVVSPGGITIVTAYNRHGQTISVTSAGNVTAYQYDLNGNLISVSDNLSATDGRPLEQRTYDRAGREVTRVDSRGATTKFSYDAANRVLTRTDDNAGAALVTRYSYDGQGRVWRVEEPNGRITQTTYDRAGRVKEVAVDPDSMNLRTTYSYDRMDHVIEVTEGFGSTIGAGPRVTRYVYDDLGRRVEQIIDPRVTEGDGKLNLVTSYRYDDNGNLTRKIDAAGSTWYVYDASDRVIFSVDALGGLTETTYDIEGRIVGVRRLATAMSAAALANNDSPSLNQLSIQRSDALDRFEQTLYDLDGRPVFTVDTMGVVTQRTFDANGNITRQVSYATPIDVTKYADEQAVTDALRARGVNTTTPSANDRVQWTSYDARNRATFTVDGLLGVTRNEYDAAGNVTRVTAYAERFTGNPASSSDLESFATTQATRTGNRVTRMWYDGLNRPRFVLDAEGYLRETRYLPAAREQVAIAYATRTTIAENAQYADLVALTTAATPFATNLANQSTTTHFDAAGRVDFVRDAAQSIERWGYDAAGNRISFTNKKGDQWNYVYDANGRLLEEHSPPVEISIVGYTSSGLGTTARTGRIITRMTYDGLGNVTSRREGITLIDGVENLEHSRFTEFGYDKLGRQIRTDFPDAEVYNYDTGHTQLRTDLYSETTYDTLGNATRLRDISGRYSYKAYDRLGRITHELDTDIGAAGASQHYVTKREYDTFGNVTSLTRYAQSIAPPAFTNNQLNAAQLGTTIAAIEANEFNRTIRTEYDRLDRVVYVRQPDVWVFDSERRQTYQSAPITYFEYNAFGDVIRESRLVRGDLVNENRPDPNVANAWAHTHRYYDRRGNKIAELDPELFLTRFEYDDASGDLTGKHEYATKLTSAPADLYTVPTGAALTPPDTMAGNQLQPRTGYDRRWTYTYDKLNRLASELLHDVQHSVWVTGSHEYRTGTSVTSYEYDALGNRTAITANGVKTNTYYDQLGRVIGILEPRRALGDGTQHTPYTRFYRDVYGNLVKQHQYAADAGTPPTAGLPDMSNKENLAADRITTFKLDNYGRAVLTQDAKGAQRYAAYTERGEIASEWQWVTVLNADNGMLDSDQLSTVYRYDALGRQIEVIEPHQVASKTRISQADYNAFGEITAKRVLGLARSEYFKYDNAGRVWNSNSGEGVDKVNLYDLAGNVTAQVRNREYDLEQYQTFGQAWESLRLDGPGSMRTEMIYDLLGRLEEQRDPTHALLANYEAVSVPLVVGGEDPGYLTFGYVAFGSPPTFTYRIGNGTPIELPIETTQNFRWGVNISNLPAGEYTYELTYSRDGVTYGKSIGTLTITGPGVGWAVDETEARLVVGYASATRYQTFDRWGNAISVTDTARNTTEYRYNQLNQLVAIQQPETQVLDTTGGTIGYEVDSQGNLTVVPRRRPTSFNRYDLLGRLIATQDARGNINRVEYNEAGQKLTDIVADDAQFQGQSRTHYIYDGFGQQIVVRDGSGYETRYRYSQVGELIGMAKEITQGAFDLQVASWFPQLDQSRLHYDYVLYSYGYDEAGRRVAETTGEFMNGPNNPVAETKLYWYDSHGNLIRARDPRGRVRVDLPEGGVYELRFETVYEYDANGNKIREIDGNGSVTEWQYDYFKRLVSHKQMSNSNTLVEYSSSMYGPVGDTIAYEYDEAGLLKLQTSSFGQYIRYSYDGAGHLTKITERGLGYGSVPGDPSNPARPLLFGVNRDTEYRYDQYGRRVRERLVIEGLEHQDAQVTYDELNRLSTVTDLRSTIQYSYDALGNRTRIHATYVDNLNVQRTQDLWYVYDSMNRVRISQGRHDGGVVPNVTIDGTPAGVELEYDARGHRSQMRTHGIRAQRVIWEQEDIYTGERNGGVRYDVINGVVTERYFYDGLGRLITTEAEQDQRWTFNEVDMQPITSSFVEVDLRSYDRASRQTFQETRSVGRTADEEWRRVRLDYDDNGRLTSQKTYDYSRIFGTERIESAVIYGDASYTAGSSWEVIWPDGSTSTGGWPSGWSSGFDGAGVLRGYVVRVYEDDGDVAYTTTHNFDYRLGAGYQEVKHHAQSAGTNPHGTPLPGSTSRQYNVNGELVAFKDDHATMNTAQNNRLFANNAAGQVVSAIPGYYHYNPDFNPSLFRGLFELSSEIASPGQLNRYWNNQQLGTLGTLQQERGAFLANFDVNYTPISDHYPTPTPSEVTVQVGDTLRAIAQRLFGDGSLWYILADANGLQMGPDDELIDQVGWPLRVPNEVVSMSNSDSSFKPFDISEVLGDTTPTQPMPPPPAPRKKGCGVVGQILVIVVAIVVTYLTYGAASEAIPAAWGTAGQFAAGAVAGAAGSIASQGVGIAIGAQEKFNWKSVAASALTSGILKGTPIGQVAGAGADSFAQLALQGAVNSAVSQGVNIVLGLQKSFSWKEVAISAASAAVSGEIGQRTEHMGAFASAIVTGASSALVRRAIGGRMDTDAVLADVFGTAIGNSIVDGLTPGQSAEAARLVEEGYLESQSEFNAQLEQDLFEQQFSDIDGQVSAAYQESQALFNSQLQQEVRSEQFQLSQQLDLERSLGRNPQFTANVSMPVARYQERPVHAVPRPVVVANRDPVLDYARVTIADGWKDAIREASYSGVDWQFANAFDELLATPSGATPRAVPGQQFSDALYLPGYFPISRHDVGIASLTVNGTLNLATTIVNMVGNALEAVTEPLDRYQGEITSVETGLGPGGMAAVGPTLLLARFSSAMRAQRIFNAQRMKSWQVSTGGLRNEIPLTSAQQAEAVAYARSLGMTEDAIFVSENMNTSYKLLFGQERLYIGTDVLPAVGTGLRANSRIGMQGALAHEIVGHRAAELAGKTQVIDYLEEAQASIRAARFAPGLANHERVTLIRDGLERLHRENLRIRDVKDLLWIDQP